MASREAPASSPRIFESSALERLTRAHPAVPVAVFVPVIAGLAALGVERLPPTSAIAIALAGYLVWTLAEYWLHRALFHLEPARGIGARLHWLIHGVHHDHPEDRARLVMPPAASVPLALSFFALFVSTLGATAAMPFTAGFLAGYLAYDLTHFHLHHGRPRTRLGRRLREQHMRHHFEDDTRGFGVSVPWWDVVFGTAPRLRPRR